MDITEDLGDGIKLRTCDGELPNYYTVKYQVIVNGKIAWQRHAVAGTHPRHRIAIAAAQRVHALHLITLLKGSPS